MKNEYVVFTPTNARVLVNPSEKVLSEINPRYIVLKNPIKAAVHKLPPHYWKPDVFDNQILPMNDEEKRMRDKILEAYHAHPHHKLGQPPVEIILQANSARKFEDMWPFWLVAVGSVLLAILFAIFIK